MVRKAFTITVQIAILATLLTACNSRSASITKSRLPEYDLASGDYGWVGKIPNGPFRILGQEIVLEVHTREVPYDPKVLPPISTGQAALVRTIEKSLPEILNRAEQAMVAYNDHDPNFREHVTNPHIWLPVDPERPDEWTLVIEMKDAPGFGYHIEFNGTNFVEIWSGT